MSRFSFTLSATLLAVLAGCSSPNLDGTNFACASDADCTDGNVCGTRGGASVCIAPNTDDLVVGMSAPLEGPNQELGLEMQRGVNALFERVNSDGGIFGRQITLNCLNDNYEADLALENTKVLLDIQEQVPDLEEPDIRGENSVLALLGSVGTPPMLETAPLATKNRTVFFAPFTGAQKYLRDGTDSPYVYNLRAGYYQETDAIVEYLSTTRSPRVITDVSSYTNVIAFTQKDAYGDAGYLGLVNSYNNLIGPLPTVADGAPGPIRRVQYTRDNLTEVDAAIETTKQHLAGLITAAGTRVSVAIVMVDTYVPGSRFVRQLKNWINENPVTAINLDVVFIHLSFVGSDALAKALTAPPATYSDINKMGGATAYAEGVIVTQVVPYYDADLPGIEEYRADLERLDAEAAPSFTSLEGYLAAKLFVEALTRNGAAIDTESLVHTLDTRIVDVDLGIGIPLNFDAADHQASDTVWISELQINGSFAVPFVWDPESGIIANSN